MDSTRVRVKKKRKKNKGDRMSIKDILNEEQLELQQKIEEINDIIYSLVDETVSKDNLPKNVLNLMLEKKRYVKMQKESSDL